MTKPVPYSQVQKLLDKKAALPFDIDMETNEHAVDYVQNHLPKILSNVWSAKVNDDLTSIRVIAVSEFDIKAIMTRFFKADLDGTRKMPLNQWIGKTCSSNIGKFVKNL